MKTPLLPGWTAHNDPTGRTYYAHIATGKSQWEVPVAASPPPPPSDMSAHSQAARENYGNDIGQPVQQQQANVQVIYVPVNSDGTISNLSSSHAYSVKNTRPLPIGTTTTAASTTAEPHPSPTSQKEFSNTSPQHTPGYHTQQTSPSRNDTETQHEQRLPPVEHPVRKSSQMHTHGSTQTSPSPSQRSPSQVYTHEPTTTQSSSSAEMVFNPISPQPFRKKSPEYMNTVPKTLTSETTRGESNINQPEDIATPSAPLPDDVPYILQHLPLGDFGNDGYNTAPSPASIEPLQPAPRRNDRSHKYRDRHMSATHQLFEKVPPPAFSTGCTYHLFPHSENISCPLHSHQLSPLSAPATPQNLPLTPPFNMELASRSQPCSPQNPILKENYSENAGKRVSTAITRSSRLSLSTIRSSIGNRQPVERFSTDAVTHTRDTRPVVSMLNDYVLLSPTHLRFTKTRTLDARVCFAGDGEVLFKIGKVGINGGLPATSNHSDDDVIKAAFDNNDNLIYELLQVKRFTMSKRRSGRMFVRDPKSGTIIATVRKRSVFGGPFLAWPGDDDSKTSPFLELKRISFLSRVPEYIISDLANQRVAATVTCLRADDRVRSRKAMPFRTAKIEPGVNIALLCLLVVAADGELH